MDIFSIFTTLWSFFNHYYYQLIGVAIEAPPVVEMTTELAIYVPQGSKNLERHEIQVFIPKDGVHVTPFQVCIIVLIIYILLTWIKGLQEVSKEEEEAAINERYLEQSEDLMDSTSSHRVAQYLENTSQSANDISNFLQIETVEYFPAEKEDNNESIGSIYEEASDELESKDISVPNVLKDLDGIKNRLEEVKAEAGSVSARSSTFQEFISLEESIDELETMDVPSPSGLSSDGNSREERQTMDVSLSEGSEYKMQISDDLKNETVFGDDSTFNAQGALPTDEEDKIKIRQV